MSSKILLVDDNDEICEIIEILLNNEGYEVISANSGNRALSFLKDHQNIDLIILDIMMPEKSGFETCQEIRKITTAPILFLSAKTQVEDKELALILGGDDYLQKPFSSIELIARTKALLRRYAIYQGKGYNSNLDILQIGQLQIHISSGEVTLLGEPISLRYMEYRLLVHLASNRGKIFSAQELYETIWEQPFLAISNNTVVAHIKNLRRKIEKDPKKPKYIITVWGRGYQIV